LKKKSNLFIRTEANYSTKKNPIGYWVEANNQLQQIVTRLKNNKRKSSSIYNQTRILELESTLEELLNYLKLLEKENRALKSSLYKLDKSNLILQ
jgi:hypothetical protein